jgi:hypothetical protein
MRLPFVPAVRQMVAWGKNEVADVRLLEDARITRSRSAARISPTKWRALYIRSALKSSLPRTNMKSLTTPACCQR